MLYVTTRNQRDTYTPQQVLTRDRGRDGGLFLPERWPDLSLGSLSPLPFTGRIARVLNILLDGDISQWDVDFCVGRHPVSALDLSGKMTLLQCWHNQGGEFSYLVRTLASRLRQDGREIATDWMALAARIAVLGAVFGEDPGTQRDIAVPTGTLHGPVSAWYARQLGFPIGNIILCANENGQLWELLHRGQLRTDSVSVATRTPLGDVALPTGLERLICAAGGTREVENYLDTVRRGGVYAPEEELLCALRRGCFVSVVGQQRMEAELRGLYARGILLSPYDALCYAGVLDYRARTGENRPCLLLSARSPRLDREVVTDALGGGPEQTDQEERE